MMDTKVDVAYDHTWEVIEANDEHSSSSKTPRHNVEGNQSPGKALIPCGLIYDKPIWNRRGRNRDMMGNAISQTEDRLCCYIIMLYLIKG